MATLGGNVLQRPRCWYFRNARIPCWLKGGVRCFAIEGDTLHFAIDLKPKSGRPLRRLANLAANPYIDPRILSDPVVYTTPEIRSRLYWSAEVSPSLERLRTRTWTRIKTAR